MNKIWTKVKKLLRLALFNANLVRHLNHKQKLIGAGSLLMVIVLMFSLVLQIKKVKATTLTWTSNADFLMNKPGECNQVNTINLQITADDYTDTDCQDVVEDASLKLENAAQNMTNMTTVAAGYSHTLVLKNDGTVWSWGRNNVGQLGDGTTVDRILPVQVKDPTGNNFLQGITAVAGGAQHSMALKNDGTVLAWGHNSFSQLGIGSTANRSLPTVVSGPAGAGALSGISKIAAGVSSSLALKNDGTVWSWGRNFTGALGDNSTSSRSTPVQVKSPDGLGFLSGAVDISVSGSSDNYARDSSMAVKGDGTLWSWGANSYGLLGDGTADNRLLPVQVKNSDGSGYLTSVKTASIGSTMSVAVLNDGTVWSWGRGGNGQLGNGSNLSSYLPVQVKDNAGLAITNIQKVFIGHKGSFNVSADNIGFTLALKDDGTVWSWGVNNEGQLGHGALASVATQVKSPDGTSFLNNIIDITAGTWHSVAVDSSGAVFAWGLNNYGQAGTAEEPIRRGTRPLPGKVLMSYTVNPAGNDFAEVKSNDDNTIALKNDGTVWMWGRNHAGQLGNDTTVDSGLPVQVKDGTGGGYLNNIKHVAMAASAAYALTNDGELWAWGNNGNAQLGDNTITSRSLPVKVKDGTGTGYLNNIKTIASGLYYNIVLTNNGELWAWGRNANMQLGDGSNAQRNLPVPVKDSTGDSILTNIKSIAAGDSHSGAVTNDGKVWMWGRNNYGQLGDGFLTDKSLPTQTGDSLGLSALTGIDDLTIGQSHTIALKTDGTVLAWGANGNGQLGDGTTISKPLPAPVKDSTGSGNLTNVKELSSGRLHSVALTNDGYVSSWGYNAYGQIGNWSVINVNLPVGLLKSIQFTGGYLPTGIATGYVVDSGDKRRSKWSKISWNSQPLPANVTTKFSVRTSDNNIDWSPWTAFTESTIGNQYSEHSLASVASSRYIDIMITLTTTGDMNTTPVINDFSLDMLVDVSPPATNASNPKVFKSNGGAEVTSSDWNTSPSPYFNWDVAVDDNDGTGIAGYCLYLGSDRSADVTSTKGDYLGSSPLDSHGLCPYAVESNNLDLSIAGSLSTAIPSSNNPYYLLIKAFDKSNNLFNGAATELEFIHDVTPPKNISFVTVPSQFVASKDVTISWPTSGSQTASDSISGLVGLQYKIGDSGIWQGLAHNGAQDTTDVIPVGDGSYQMDPTHDYLLLNEGNNMIYFRAIDNAGNVSTTTTSAVIKINSSAPSTPEALTALPSTSAQNNFAFTWQAPSTFVGTPSTLVYCYTVNTLPTANTCTYTSPGQTGLTAGPFATQPGENTLYVAAKDEAGNINYATAASITFTANTAAPGVPLNTEIADISVKSTQSWKLAISWEPPTSSVVSNYRVYRSLDPNGTYSQVATTQGNSFVDTNLSAVRYYYKIRACDSANNCGVETAPVNMLPTGRYTSPAELIGTPTVQASTRKATVQWVTERGSDSRVQIGTESGKYQPTEFALSDQTKTHQVDVSGLEAGTVYSYRVRWTDEDGNTGTSSEMTFKTLPAPTIQDVEVIKTSLSGATIKFTSSNATKVNLYFGRGDSLGDSKPVNTSTEKSTYTVELDNLDDGSKYSFRPDGTDSDGNTYNGDTYTFSTPPRPQIYNLKFQPVTGEPTSTQKVTWSTNVPTNSQISYSTTDVPAKEIVDSSYVTEHSMTIKNLKDDSEYSLVATGRDIDGNLATSDNQTFRTALDTRPPVISDIKSEVSIKGNGGDAKGQLIVSWKTDESSSSQVMYGQASKTYNGSTVDNSKYSQEHTV
ncbi:fibronectin type III domain-containing protein, partial [Candidatus Saccharibacteria bacterium]|nr:fibronectin type III domain-containing protein [Candidatus Saccharibacteria bacterium]